MPYFSLILLLIWILALVDSIVADENRVRYLPKAAWVLIVVLLPLIGSAMWFAAGRPLRSGGPVPRTIGRPAYEPPRPAPAPQTEEEFRRQVRERAEAQRRKARDLDAD